MIPKTIHYCWFGDKQISPLSKRCISSWEHHLPNYEKIKWDESNSPIDEPIVSHALKNRMWAFAADFTRLHALYHLGGIYLDTDMEIIRSFEELLDNQCILAEESEGVISAGFIAAEPRNSFILKCIERMRRNFLCGIRFMPIPNIVTSVHSDFCTPYEVKILTRHSFYPYNPYDKSQPVKQLMFQDITSSTYGIHHWEKSWKQGILKRAFYKANNKIRSAIRV